MSKTEYNIRKRGSSWQAILSRKVTGIGRIMITRKTKAEAEADAIRELQRIRETGNDRLDLTADEVRACSQAVRILKEKGFAGTIIVEASLKFANENDPARRQRTVSEVIEEFLQSKRGGGTAPITIEGYSAKFKVFAREFGTRFVHEIEPVDVERWFDHRGMAGENRKDYRRRLSILWRFAIARKYAMVNAPGAISKVIVKREIPTVLTPMEIRSLLFVAKSYNLGRMLPFLAIGAFCGLRPWELRRTLWSDINFETRQIYVTPEAAKTNQDRFVDMSDCLLEWLELVPKSTRHSSIYWTRAGFNAVRRKAGLLKKWDSDILRHSAASHLYAKTQNAALVMAQMGHGLNVFLKHYKRAVTKVDGDAYYQVLPTDKETKVLPLNMAVAQ
jgi:integrase